MLSSFISDALHLFALKSNLFLQKNELFLWKVNIFFKKTHNDPASHLSESLRFPIHPCIEWNQKWKLNEKQKLNVNKFHGAE